MIPNEPCNDGEVIDVEQFKIENLPDIDQREIKRGKCPWCLSPLVPMTDSDVCSDPDCGDVFVGKLTIED